MCDVPLSVVQEDRASLLGRYRFAPLVIAGGGIHRTSTEPTALQPYMDKFRPVFYADLIGCTDLPAHLELLKGATPNLLKAHPVSFVISLAVKPELDRLERKASSSRPSILGGRCP